MLTKYGQARNMGPPPFSPLSLFAAGEVGAWYDPSDLSSMFQDVAGAVPAVVDQTVALILDKSGRGNHASQATAAAQPILRFVDGRYYLEFDGTDDFLSTDFDVDFTGTDEVSVFAGLRKTSDSALRTVVQLGLNFSTLTGTFALLAPGGAGARVDVVSKGTLQSTSTFSSAIIAAPVTYVQTAQCKISTDTNVNRVNAVQRAAPSIDQGSGNYGNYPLFVGRGTGPQTFSGNVYGIIVRGKLSSTDEIDATEAWMNGRTGAY